MPRWQSPVKRAGLEIIYRRASPCPSGHLSSNLNLGEKITHGKKAKNHLGSNAHQAKLGGALSPSGMSVSPSAKLLTHGIKAKKHLSSKHITFTKIDKNASYDG